MLPLRRRNRIDKVRHALHEASSYTHTMRDRKLRSRMRGAIGHGALAAGRVRRDVNGGHVTRLASDKKLHRNVQALLADVKAARKRMERKRGHRVRNMLLLVTGTGAAVAAIPSSRRWLAEKLGRAGDGTASAAGAY